MIYTDFSKAFDTVDHALLFYKLDEMNLLASLLYLLQDYLIYRKNVVQYNGISSIEFTPTSGVPQGSVLGYLLFNSFINDLISHITVDKLLYVDDLKIFTSIKTQDDVELFQKNLKIFHDWCLDKKLKLNLSKCHVVTFSKKDNPIYFNYFVHDRGSSINHELVRKNFVTDLGVNFDSKLTFKFHLKTIERYASKALETILRNYKGFKNLKNYHLTLQLFRFI